MSQIILNSVSIGYKYPLIRNLSLRLEKGSCLCIVGENGTGKSTLLKTIAELSKNTLLEGEFQIPSVGYLSQRHDIAKDFPATVREVVLSAYARTAFFLKRGQKEEAIAIMGRLDVLDLQNKSFSKLSGGQQQRVLIARALCANKDVLLLDEPTASLDPIKSAQFYSLVKELTNSGITILMVTHDIEASLSCATHVLELTRNEEYFFGTKEEYQGGNLV